MPRHCSAGGCKSRDTRDSRKTGITFHRLPKRENPRRALWILNSQRTGPQGQGPWDPQSDFIYFCSKHFTKDSFELSGVSGYRRLKDDALPTLFESSGPKGRAAKKTTRGRGKQTGAGRPARTKNRSRKVYLYPDDAQQTPTNPENVIGGEASQSSEAANGEADGEQGADTESSLRAPSETPETPLETHQSACNTTSEPLQPPSSPRPPSPSRYMRRLPPPPGFYLPREHSYAQLCPLVWRKRYDRAIDNLEKALRLLSAARRRENRLRHALARLQESRLKSTLSRLREGGGRGKEGRGGGPRGRSTSWSAQRGGDGEGGGGETHRSERGASLGSTEDSETEGATEDVDMRGEEAGGWRVEGRAKGPGEREEDDGGCCFYCGRGKNDEEASRNRVSRSTGVEERDGEIRRRRQVAKRGRGRKPVETRDEPVADTPNECYLYYYQTSEKDEDAQVITLGLPQPQREMTSETGTDIHGNQLRPVTDAHQQAEPGCVQVHSLAGMPFPTSVTLQDSASTAPAIQLLTSSSSLPQGLMLTDLVPSDGTTMVEEQQEYWVQHTTDGSMVLLPVTSPEEGGAVSVRGLPEEVETRTIFVSDVGFHSSQTEDREGIRVESDSIGVRVSGAGDRQGSIQSNVKGVVLSGDVKEKLKEHLEGFQLQLSNEFND